MQNLAGGEDVVGYICSVQDDAAHRVGIALIRCSHVAEDPLIDSLVHLGELVAVAVFLCLFDGAKGAQEEGRHAVDPARDNDARLGDVCLRKGLPVNLQVAADCRSVEQHRPDRGLRVAVVGEHLEVAVRPQPRFCCILQAAEGIAAEGQVKPDVDEAEYFHPGRQVLHLLQWALPGLAEVDVLVEAGMSVVVHRVPVANVHLPAALHKAVSLQGRDVMPEVVEGEGHFEFKDVSCSSIAVGTVAHEVDGHMVAEHDQAAVGHPVLLENVGRCLHGGLGVLRVAGRLAEGSQGPQQVLGAVELCLHDRLGGAAEGRGHRSDRGGRAEPLTVQVACEHRRLRRSVDIASMGDDGVAVARGGGEEFIGGYFGPGEGTLSDPVGMDTAACSIAVDTGGGPFSLRHGAGGDEGHLVAGPGEAGLGELLLVGDQADACEHAVLLAVLRA